jgi:hypothetical protein
MGSVSSKPSVDTPVRDEESDSLELNTRDSDDACVSGDAPMGVHCVWVGWLRWCARTMPGAAPQASSSVSAFPESRAPHYLNWSFHPHWILVGLLGKKLREGTVSGSFVSGLLRSRGW